MKIQQKGISVFDATQVARSIEQIQNQLEQLKKMESQLKEAQCLYDSFNKTGNINDLLVLLNDPKVRQHLPADAQ
jgi:aerobic-type carbon monoxide dehydrogenase small subunit (CoxS/CutS family)